MLTETNGFSILFKVTDSNALSRAFPMIIHRSMSSKGKTVVTCQKWHLPRGYSIWCIVVLTSLIWKIRPVINESRPVSTEEYKSFVSKLKVVLIVIVMVAVVLEINHNNIYLNIMISGLLLTAITLIMGKVKYRQYKT